jgi:hypothetical protein
MRNKDKQESIVTAIVAGGGIEAEPDPVPADCPHYEEFTMYARSTQALGATAARGRLIELSLRVGTLRTIRLQPTTATASS